MSSDPVLEALHARRWGVPLAKAGLTPRPGMDGEQDALADLEQMRTGGGTAGLVSRFKITPGQFRAQGWDPMDVRHDDDQLTDPHETGVAPVLDSDPGNGGDEGRVQVTSYSLGDGGSVEDFRHLDSYRDMERRMRGIQEKMLQRAGVPEGEVGQWLAPQGEEE